MTFRSLVERSTVETKIIYRLHRTIFSDQVEQQSWDEDHMEERSVEETASDEPPTKLLIVGNSKEYISTANQISSSVTILSSTDSSQNNHNADLSLRSPSSLKTAIRNQGQSLLKNNSITMHVRSSNGNGGAVSISTATDESKRTQWKCKRCNYRDSNKDNVLLHVKSHYESTDQESIEERVSCLPFLI